jgi:hypothetical protein
MSIFIIYLYYKERRQLETFLTQIGLPLMPDPPVICFWEWIWWKDYEVPKNRNLESLSTKRDLFSHPPSPYPPACTRRAHFSFSYTARQPPRSFSLRPVREKTLRPPHRPSPAWAIRRRCNPSSRHHPPLAPSSQPHIRRREPPKVHVAP